jgi:hypothetical protein
MKEGDIVVMKSDSEESFSGEPYWEKGDKAKLLYKDASGDWWADFSINDEYFGDGEWCIGNKHDEFKLVNKRYSAWGVDRSYPYKWMADLAEWLYWKKRCLLKWWS